VLSQRLPRDAPCLQENPKVNVKPEVEIWRRPKKSTFWPWFPIRSFRQFLAKTYHFRDIATFVLQYATFWHPTSSLPKISPCSLGGKRGDYQDCSVLYCVLKQCTVISTLRWAVLTVLWIGFCHTGPISLCIDLFVFICVYFVCFCFLLHVSCNIVSTPNL